MKKNEFIKAVIPLPSGGFDIFTLIFCFTSNIVLYPLVVDVSGDIVFTARLFHSTFMLKYCVLPTGSCRQWCSSVPLLVAIIRLFFSLLPFIFCFIYFYIEILCLPSGSCRQ